MVGNRKEYLLKLLEDNKNMDKIVRVDDLMIIIKGWGTNNYEGNEAVGKLRKAKYEK